MALTKEFAQRRIDEGISASRTDPHAWVTKNYHEKAKLLANHFEPFVGHAAIEKYYIERNNKDPKGEYEMKYIVDEANESGDMGFVEGHFHLKKKSDNSILDLGKFLTILKKGGQDWLLFRVMYNTNKPAQH